MPMPECKPPPDGLPYFPYDWIPRSSLSVPPHTRPDHRGCASARLPDGHLLPAQCAA